MSNATTPRSATALVIACVAACGACNTSPPVTPTVTTLGDSFQFAIVGDTRPASPDDVAGYPTPIITAIWDDLEQLTSRPDFAISTGDYQFSSPGSSATVDAQLDLYLGAREHFTNPVYPAMGNHECTGATTSNCGPDNGDGVTPIYAAFMTRMMKPLSFTQPYFEVRFAAADGSWTMKVVAIAGNAWDSAQATWLDQVLADPTTYTIVVRHEGTIATAAPGVTPSETILQNHPYTLKVVGHVHTYQHNANYKEVICGNGGAPPTSGTNYGYAVVERLDGGTLQLTAYDYMSNAAIDRFRLNPDGSPAP